MSLVIHQHSLSQQPPAFPEVDAPPAAISFFAPFFIPKILQDVYQHREYILSDEFREFRRTYGDIHAVDALYHRALELTWGNTHEALFVCLLNSIEHRRVDFRLPLIGLVIPVPLTYEFEDEFNERVHALPNRLYADTPKGTFGDVDKLQHFFGSAFVTAMSESEEAADNMGHFVEMGESRYVPGEVIDERDIRSNRQGQRFGLAVLAGEDVMPSRYITGADSLHTNMEQR
ncbi:MAG: hypothetical protein ACKVRP_08820 [Bacteroidota bacterium]